ncbi:MAG: hypothetical protein WD850_03190 [Candidatus Spechtbacterales bacterium]
MPDSKRQVVGQVVEYPIQPSDISTELDFMDTLGRAELESSGFWVVRLAQRRGGWSPFTRDELWGLHAKENPSQRHPRLQERDLDELLGNRTLFAEMDGQYYVTHEFVSSCFRGSPALKI